MSLFIRRTVTAAGALLILLPLIFWSCAGDAGPGLRGRSDLAPKMVSEREMASDLSRDRDVEFNTEEYTHLEENPFLTTIDHPLSTFSIDVDTASYTLSLIHISEPTRPY